MSNELCFQSAVQLASLVRSGELSARELLDAHLDQIDRVNPQVNAIVTLTDDLARKQAAAADEAQARGESLGPLHGVRSRPQGSTCKFSWAPVPESWSLPKSHPCGVALSP